MTVHIRAVARSKIVGMKQAMLIFTSQTIQKKKEIRLVGADSDTIKMDSYFFFCSMSQANKKDLAFITAPNRIVGMVKGEPTPSCDYIA